MQIENAKLKIKMQIITVEKNGKIVQKC